MTGSDSDEARQVSQADLATFRQDVANEMAQQMAQLQAALDRAMNDLAATIRAPAPVGGGCAYGCLLYTSPSPRDLSTSRMPSSA